MILLSSCPIIVAMGGTALSIATSVKPCMYVTRRADAGQVLSEKKPQKDLPKTMASWSKRATMSSARMGFTAAALEDASSPSSKIVVFGGTDWSSSGGRLR